jgi:Family of unknown function (DUF5681)
MANEENLKPFKKGQSGNLKGRPRKLPGIDKLLIQVLGEKQANSQGVEMTAAEAVFRGLLARAVKGDTRAAEILLDRAYGKVVQRNELTGKDGKDLPILQVGYGKQDG